MTFDFEKVYATQHRTMSTVAGSIGCVHGRTLQQACVTCHDEAEERRRQAEMRQATTPQEFTGRSLDEVVGKLFPNRCLDHMKLRPCPDCERGSAHGHECTDFCTHGKCVTLPCTGCKDDQESVLAAAVKSVDAPLSCRGCARPMNNVGALLLSPPTGTNRMTMTTHLCVDCYVWMTHLLDNLPGH